MTPEQIAAREADERTGKERQLANLAPKFQPGKGGNPTGKNGRDKLKILVDYLEAMDPKETTDKPRILVLLESMFMRARLGHSGAIKVLCEQYFGKPRQALDLSSNDGTMRPSLIRFEFMRPPGDDGSAGT